MDWLGLERNREPFLGGLRDRESVPQLRISDPVSSLVDPASLSIHSNPRFPIEGLRYVISVETSLDGGPWRTLGWASYPGGGCGTTITGIFPQTELHPGLHRLDVRTFSHPQPLGERHLNMLPENRTAWHLWMIPSFHW